MIEPDLQEHIDRLAERHAAKIHRDSLSGSEVMDALARADQEIEQGRRAAISKMFFDLAAGDEPTPEQVELLRMLRDEHGLTREQIDDHINSAKYLASVSEQLGKHRQSVERMRRLEDLERALSAHMFVKLEQVRNLNLRQRDLELLIARRKEADEKLRQLETTLATTPRDAPLLRGYVPEPTGSIRRK